MHCSTVSNKRPAAIFYFFQDNININNLTAIDTVCNLTTGFIYLCYLINTKINYISFINSSLPGNSVLIETGDSTKSLEIKESSIINSSLGEYIYGENNLIINQSNFYMANTTILKPIFDSFNNVLYFIDNATIINCNAKNFLFLYNGDAIKTSIIKNIYLENNYFYNEAISVSKSFLIIENTIMINNYIKDERGAMLYIVQSNVTISNMSMGPNNGSFFFGYLFVSSESILTAKDVLFSNNAGQIANSFYSYGNLNINLDHCSFINSKGSSIDLISFFDKLFYIKNSLFQNSGKESIRIFWNINQLVISSTRFENIPSYAIELINNPNALIKSCTFIASPYYPKFDSLRMQGIYSEVTNLDIHNCVFTNMRSDKDGAAVWTSITFSENTYPSSNFRIWNSQFINCSATRGGAIFLSVQPINTTSFSSKPLFSGLIAKSSFVNNTALVSGGALAFSCDKNIINCKFIITDTLFSGNLVIKSESYKDVKYYYSNISSTGNIVEKDINKFETQVVGPPSIIKLTNGKKIFLTIEEKKCINLANSKILLIFLDSSF